MKRRLIVAVMLIQVSLLATGPASAQNVTARTVPFFGGQITLPAGYKTEHVRGPDFDVDYVIPEGTTANTAKVMFGIYDGSHSSFEPPKTGVTTESGSFGGKSFEWKVWQTTDQGKTAYQYQALIRLEGGQWVWHLFISAPEMKQIEVLKEIVRSYRSPAPK
jgi:hypothetical protein